jgi:ubiquinone/menaquinone biosynthesis C-methylase UbiE
MSYNSVIYPDTENDYPKKLSEYLIFNYMKYGDILDIGCGKGTYLKLFNSYAGSRCYGVDLRKENYDVGKIGVCDIEKEELRYPDNSFDNIFSKSLIEHLYNPENMIKESYRVLKDRGKIIIMTPDWKSQMSHFWDDYTHVHPYTEKSLMNLLKIHGFKDVTVKKFYQLPFIWKYPWLKFVPKIISLLPDFLKWKDSSMTNGRDRKLIRFSKEKMLIATGVK